MSEYIYGDSIAAIQQDTNAAPCRFRVSRTGARLVVGADGVYTNSANWCLVTHIFREATGRSHGPIHANRSTCRAGSSLTAKAVGYVIYRFDQTQLRVGVGFGVEPGEVPHDMDAQRRRLRRSASISVVISSATRRHACVTVLWESWHESICRAGRRARALVGDAGCARRRSRARVRAWRWWGRWSWPKHWRKPEDFGAALPPMSAHAFVKLTRVWVDGRHGHVPDDQLTRPRTVSRSRSALSLALPRQKAGCHRALFCPRLAVRRLGERQRNPTYADFVVTRTTGRCASRTCLLFP